MTHAAYILSSYSFINTSSLEKLLKTGYPSKDGNPIPSFDEKLLIELCSDARLIFEKESNILEIKGDIIVVGDIHGSLHDLLRILKYIQQTNAKVLFLGDYVDRGNFSLECITILFALKIMEPDKYFLIRGNHEFDSICSQYGFLDEVINYHNPKKVKKTESFRMNSTSDTFQNFFDNEKIPNTNFMNSSDDVYTKYSTLHKEIDCYQFSRDLYDAFIETFSYLPLAAIVNKTNLCLHGGLGPDFENLNQIRNEIKRPIYDFEDNKLISDIVWSDPVTISSFYFSDNPRGRGFLFNKDALIDFLNENSLKRLIRGHECVKEGSVFNFYEKCVTVFSASSYSYNLNNNSGILKLFEKDNSIEFVNFPSLPRLEKSNTVYYKVQAFHLNGQSVRNCFSFRHPHLTLNVGVKMAKNKAVKYSKSPLRYNSKQLNHKPIPSKATLIHKPFINQATSLDLDSKSLVLEIND